MSTDSCNGRGEFARTDGDGIMQAKIVAWLQKKLCLAKPVLRVREYFFGIIFRKVMKVETKAKVKIENDAEHQNAILTVMNKLRKKHQHHGVFSSAPRLTYTHTHTHAVSRFDGKL